MSDPVTNVQIEDVLSSIRKLVSEEVRAQTTPLRRPIAEKPADPVDSAPPEKPAPAPVSMLVLTPAHRIAEVTTVDADRDDNASRDDEAALSPDGDGDDLIESGTASDEDAAGFDVDFVEEGDDQDASHSALHDEAIWADQAEQKTAEANVSAEDDGFDIAAFSRELLLNDTSAKDRVAAAFEAAAEATAGPASEATPDDLTPMARFDSGSDYEDEGANAAAALDLPAFADQDAAEALLDDEDEGLTGGGLAASDALLGGPDADANSAPGHPAESEPDDDVVAARAAGAIPSFLRSRGITSMDEPIAEMEPAVSRASATFRTVDPRDDDQEAFSAGTMPWEDHADDPTADALNLRSDDPEEEIDAQVLWTDPDEDAGLAIDATSMIDEDILRDMVAEIVRQELQGALGERITRNVRKLVRREIQRSLTAHDLL
ncbi:hypothetical protein [Pseudooceanicola sp.]|uniref:hypothetical protein n=1 Tax=Pseudooceanicola sp. TaxID=1914328 RepID=UPI00261FA53D|nr:hypothetical protein [Pseudooceanicola sp.]MDF1856248.1 hypothetical protein [Pseudooceanicola sp.]